jgi:hypothetical protein
LQPIQAQIDRREQAVFAARASSGIVRSKRPTRSLRPLLERSRHAGRWLMSAFGVKRTCRLGLGMSCGKSKAGQSYSDNSRHSGGSAAFWHAAWAGCCAAGAAGLTGGTGKRAAAAAMTIAASTPAIRPKTGLSHARKSFNRTSQVGVISNCRACGLSRQSGMHEVRLRRMRRLRTDLWRAKRTATKWHDGQITSI